MHTYLRQFASDAARIDERSNKEPEQSFRHALQAGAFRASARFFASMADHEAANLRRTLSDPRRLAVAICELSPDPGYVSNLLYRLAEHLGEYHDDLDTDWQQVITYLELCGDAAHDQSIAALRRETDLDAAAAAASDEAYDRAVDAALEAK